MNVCESNADGRKIAARNSIYTIQPYKIGAAWVFDDESINVKREPFVAGADMMMELLSEGKDRFTLLFSDKFFPGHTLKVTKVEEKDEDYLNCGTYYYSPDYNFNLWLCPVLNQYYPQSPNEIYVRVI